MSVEQPTVNRRRLGATLLSLFALTAIRTDRRVAVHAFDFAGCLMDPASASAIGAAYLRSYPEHASRAVLLSFLQLPDEPLNAAQIAVALERRIRSDFEYQRTLVLERWLLSRTEAAVCGLIALG
jgi:hypothetical protein